MSEAALAIALPLLGGFSGSFFTRKEISADWYVNLQKPWWQPPGWVFGPMWTALYASMGTASYLVWRDGNKSPDSSRALAIYGASLGLNFIWTPLFFGMHRTGLALLDIAGLWLTVVATTIMFGRTSTTARNLMIPYVAWVSLASSLNAYIFFKN